MPKLAVRLALMGLVFRYFNRPFTLQTMKLLGRNPNANVLILAQLDAVEAQKVDLPNYVFDPKNVQQIQDYKKRLKEIGIDEVEIEFPSEGVFYETSFPI